MKNKIWLAVAAAAVLLAAILWLTADRTDRVGICYNDSNSEENAAYRQQLEAALTARGFEVITVEAHGDQTEQLQKISELARKKCDILLIEPVMEDAVAELLTAIEQSKLPAVLFNRKIDTDLLTNYPQIAYIGVDETQPGQLQAQMLASLPTGGDLNGDGTVAYLMLQGPENHLDTIAQTASFEAQLKKTGLHYHMLAKEYGDWSQESGRRICKQQLASFGKDIEVIVCGNDQMALGAAQAITDGGRTVGKDVYLLAIGAEGDTLQMVSEGKISGTAYLDTKMQIETVAETVFAKFHQQPTDAVKILPYTTAEN